MSDSELSSNHGRSSPAAPASPSKPTGNRYDTMFGSDSEDAGAASESEALGARPTTPPAADDDEPLDDLFGDEEKLSDVASVREPSPEPAEPERFVEVSLPRHPGPAPGDDQHLYLMKVPSFLQMEQKLFTPEEFILPAPDPSDTASAYTRATNSIRIRRDANGKLQSNARIIKWSDGTMSLQIASSTNFYDLPRKDLTTNPKTPGKYVAAQNSHTYLLDPHEAAGTLRVVGHATQSLNVVSAASSSASDYAIQRLHAELASAIPTAARATPLEISTLRDPEAERKEAERIAKEKERANKKLEAQRRRARERDPLEAQARRSYAKVTGTRSKRDSPPIMGRGRGREDEYDLEDEFIEEESDDEEEGGSEEEERRPRKGRESERDRKRRRVVEDESDDE
ncbi:Leo1-like protein-domain-containing protein [Pyronema omphalodes]|nr:Leo1-like protein-domain-containing protein [Pyronema omphalodes]